MEIKKLELEFKKSELEYKNDDSENLRDINICQNTNTSLDTDSEVICKYYYDKIENLINSQKKDSRIIKYWFVSITLIVLTLIICSTCFLIF